MSEKNATLDAAGVQPGSRLANVVAGRTDIMALTEATMEAVIAPTAPGGISSAERTALACRIARLNDEHVLAEYFEQRMPKSDPEMDQLADPSCVSNGNGRLDALVRHVDLVTLSPKDATEEDIAALKRAAVPEPDVVRLTEIIAFVNYQVRVVSGLRLLGEVV